MTSEQILTALRFVAMGRPNHPEVQALAEFLAKPEPVAFDVPLPEIVPEMAEAEDKPRRGRKPKAE